MAYTRHIRHRRIGRTRGTGIRASLGDAFDDIANWWNSLTGSASSTPTISGDVGPPEDTSPTSSSTTVQDTTTTASGAVIGGQDSGVPTATPGNWKSVAGVCYATNSAFLETLKTLQRQLNRVADAKGLAVIAVDGAVGQKTLALMNSVAGLGAYKSMANPDTSTCDAVCASVFSFIAATQMFADGLGASSSVASPAGSPQVFNPTTGALQSQSVAGDLSDAWGNLSTTNKMVVGALAAGAAIVALRQGQKHRRKARTTRSYR